MSNSKVITQTGQLAEELPQYLDQIAAAQAQAPVGIAGFDGFIDTFIHMVQPDKMSEFGPKVAAAAGIATSFPAEHRGDKFGGNGPLIASALHGVHSGEIDLTYIGAMGREEIMEIYREALAGKAKRLVSLADPAHSDCIEFADGKVMLSDLRACEEITWERLLECISESELDEILKRSNFVAAVNWGKLIHVGEIWLNLAKKLQQLGVSAKHVSFFMDLAEFEHRSEEDVKKLLERLHEITAQCHTLLSFNLKEAWQMAEALGGSFGGRKEAEAVAELAGFLRQRIDVDRIVIHPNDGAACASADGVTYVMGPMCQQPLISTGAGDNFGAGCLSGAIKGLDDLGILLCGVAASGYFVRSGKSATFAEIRSLLEAWVDGSLPERL